MGDDLVVVVVAPEALDLNVVLVPLDPLLDVLVQLVVVEIRQPLCPAGHAQGRAAITVLAGDAAMPCACARLGLGGLSGAGHRYLLLAALPRP